MEPLESSKAGRCILGSGRSSLKDIGEILYNWDGADRPQHSQREQQLEMEALTTGPLPEPGLQGTLRTEVPCWVVCGSMGRMVFRLRLGCLESLDAQFTWDRGEGSTEMCMRQRHLPALWDTSPCGQPRAMIQSPCPGAGSLPERGRV